MALLRMMIAESMLRNVRIYAKHVGTKENGKADALSRLDLDRFWKLSGDSMNEESTPVSLSLWPMDKLWIK